MKIEVSLVPEDLLRIGEGRTVDRGKGCFVVLKAAIGGRSDMGDRTVVGKRHSIFEQRDLASGDFGRSFEARPDVVERQKAVTAFGELDTDEHRERNTDEHMQACSLRLDEPMENDLVGNIVCVRWSRRTGEKHHHDEPECLPPVAGNIRSVS